METLKTVSFGLQTVYHTCEQVDRRMVMGEIRVMEKHWGRSGD